jgi:hypothetical protein
MIRESGTVVLDAPSRKDGCTVKKVLTLVLTGVFTLSLIGCGGEPTKSTGGGTKGGTTAGATAGGTAGGTTAGGGDTKGKTTP